MTGPTAFLVSAFSAACAGGTCIPQAGTNNQLDSLADRAMFRLACRNFGTYESLVVNHAVKVGTTKRSTYTGTMSIDPVDDCTFWYTNEYLKADGTFNWSTRIHSFKLASCI